MGSRNWSIMDVAQCQQSRDRVWWCGIIEMINDKDRSWLWGKDDETTTRSTSVRWRRLDFADGAQINIPSGTPSKEVMVVWLSILAFVVVVIMVCVSYCLLAEWRRRRLARMAEDIVEDEFRQGQIDLEIARIEANVKLFSQKQEIRRKRQLQRFMRNQFVKITPAHMENCKRSSNKDALTSDLESGCSICLEPFKEGDIVAHAYDPKICKHLFHDECILSWFVSRRDQKCPCCRQPFTEKSFDQGSLASSREDGSTTATIPEQSIQSEAEMSRVLASG